MFEGIEGEYCVDEGIDGIGDVLDAIERDDEAALQTCHDMLNDENVSPATQKKKKADKSNKKLPGGLGSGKLAEKSRKRVSADRGEDHSEEAVYGKVARHATDDELMPKDLLGEIRRVARDYCEQYEEEKQLTHKQRLQLFRAIVTYLFKYAGLLEKYVTNLTVHAVTQVIVDRDGANDDTADKEYQLEVEPWEESTNRHICKIPSWLVHALKVYYLECRPHFVNGGKVKTVKRRMVKEKTWVKSEKFFLNSKGTDDFRSKLISDQFQSAVSVAVFLNTDVNEFIITFHNVVCGLRSAWGGLITYMCYSSTTR